MFFIYFQNSGFHFRDRSQISWVVVWRTRVKQRGRDLTPLFVSPFFLTFSPTLRVSPSICGPFCPHWASTFIECHFCNKCNGDKKGRELTEIRVVAVENSVIVIIQLVNVFKIKDFLNLFCYGIFVVFFRKTWNLPYRSVWNEHTAFAFTLVGAVLHNRNGTSH